MLQYFPAHYSYLLLFYCQPHMVELLTDRQFIFLDSHTVGMVETQK